LLLHDGDRAGTANNVRMLTQQEQEMSDEDQSNSIGNDKWSSFLQLADYGRRG
jgi:hypothetical protein